MTALPVLPPIGLPPIGLPPNVAPLVPAAIVHAGDRAAWRYVDFFAANIRNPNTRRAYARACGRFFAWCDGRGLALPEIGRAHV